MIINRDLAMLRLAKQESKLSDFKQVHMGCCIAIKNNVLSIGCNGEKSNPMQCKFNRFRNFDKPEQVIAKQHTEISALSKLPWYVFENDFNLKRATIYIYREHKDTHTYAMAFPCPACMEAIKQISIGRIVYTIENGIAEMKIA